MQAERKRPDGVTILGILGIIGGIIGIILGTGMVIIGPIFSQFSQVSETDIADILEDEELPDVNSTDIATGLNELKRLSGSFFIFGIFLIAEGIASILVSWGLLKGKGWAWFGAVILTVISIIFNVIVIALLGMGVDAASIGGAIVGFTVYGVILWYLCRLNVRSYFWQGKNPSTLKIM